MKIRRLQVFFPPTRSVASPAAGRSNGKLPASSRGNRLLGLSVSIHLKRQTKPDQNDKGAMRNTQRSEHRVDGDTLGGQALVDRHHVVHRESQLAADARLAPPAGHPARVKQTAAAQGEVDCMARHGAENGAYILESNAAMLAAEAEAGAHKRLPMRRLPTPEPARLPHAFDQIVHGVPDLWELRAQCDCVVPRARKSAVVPVDVDTVLLARVEPVNGRKGNTLALGGGVSEYQWRPLNPKHTLTQRPKPGS